jgi:hypothetical protein
MTSPEQTRSKPNWALAYWVAGAVAVAGFLALVTSPIADLLGDSEYAIPAALHGVAAMVYLVVGTVLAYMAYLLYVDRLQAYHDLKVLSLLSTAFSLLTIMFGNWIYIFYRASEGPRTYFLETNPAVHEIFFEFKEFAALFTLPLSMAAAAIIVREGDHLRSRPLTRQVVAVLLALSWLFLLLVFGLGAAITKLRSV